MIQAGKVGVIQDVPGYLLPIEAWTSCTNFRFKNNYAEKFKGHSEPYGTPSVAPYYLLPVQNETVQYWVYCGLTSVYVTQGTSHHDISGATYRANADDSWHGGVLNGVPFLNNGVDAPQYWSSVSPGTALSDLVNWPANTTCKILRPFKNYLIALDVTKSTGRFPQLVKWSDQADPGAAPGSWDETDPTVDAGESVLSERGGYIVDGGSLGDSFIIYREWSTWEMRYIGGRYIFSFRNIPVHHGIFARGCFTEFDGGHCVLTPTDLIIHNGASMQSIGDARMKDTLFSEIDSTNARRTYMAHHKGEYEIWICYPESGQSFATKALVWNYRYDTMGFRTLPGARHIEFDVVDSTLLGTIDSYTGTIDSYTDVYDKRLYDPHKGRLLMADTTNTRLFQIDNTNQFNGTSFTSTLQKTDIIMDGDIQSLKRITRIRPRIEATNGTQISIRVGYQNTIGASVTWGTAQTFTVGTDYKVDFSEASNGRLLAVEFETTGNVAWKLHGYDIDWKVTAQQ